MTTTTEAPVYDVRKVTDALTTVINYFREQIDNGWQLMPRAVDSADWTPPKIVKPETVTKYQGRLWKSGEELKVTTQKAFDLLNEVVRLVGEGEVAQFKYEQVDAAYNEKAERKRAKEEKKSHPKASQPKKAKTLPNPSELVPLEPTVVNSRTDLLLKMDAITCADPEEHAKFHALLPSEDLALLAMTSQMQECSV